MQIYSHFSPTFRLKGDSKKNPVSVESVKQKTPSFASRPLFFEVGLYATQKVSLQTQQASKEQRSWNKLSPIWCNYVDSGQDPYRTYFTGPAFEALIDLDSVNGQTILDAGSGSGQLVRTLVKKGANVTGLDFSSANINYAKTKTDQDHTIDQTKVRYLQGSFTEEIQNVDDPNEEFEEKFDVVISSMAAFMDSGDAKATAENFYKVLKPGGRLLISMKHPFTILRKENSVHFLDKNNKDLGLTFLPRQSYFSQKPFTKEVTIEGVNYRVHHYPFMLSSIINALTEAGLEPIKSVENRPSDELVKKDKERFKIWDMLPFDWAIELRKPEQRQHCYSPHNDPFKKNLKFVHSFQNIENPNGYGDVKDKNDFGQFSIKSFEAEAGRYDWATYPVPPAITDVADFEKGLEEHKKVLKPGGILVVVSEHLLWRLSKLEIQANELRPRVSLKGEARVPAYVLKKSYFESGLTASTLMNTITKKGFEVIGMEEPETDAISGPPNYEIPGQFVPLSLVIYARKKEDAI